MKANESVKNYPSERRMYANYVARSIKKICKEFGPRGAGTEQEKKALEWMANDLKESCDEVKTQEFTIHPGAFMGWIRLTVVFVTMAAILVFLTHFLPNLALYFSIGALVLVAISLFFIITEFILYKETLDPFYPKKTSHNVIAVRKASGDTKRRIILSGHADSAPEWRFTYWGGPKILYPVVGTGLLGVVYTVIVSVITLIFVLQGKNIAESQVMWILSIINVCLIPAFLACILFYNPKRIVEGANDDLTGCLVSMSVPRFLKDQDIRFENTEVMVLITGSEECGLRGAKAFCKEYAEKFKSEKGVETIFVGFDTVRDFDFMTIYNKDMTGTVKNDEEACALVKNAGALCGYDIPLETIALGSTDAAAFSQAGIKAASFVAMDPTPARYYHTRLDTHENLDLKTIEAGVDIALETTFMFDEKGLKA